MFLIDWRIKGVPLTFLIVVVMMVLLTIFFGAWAVSADLEDQERSLQFGFAGSDPKGGTAVTNPSAGDVSGAPSDQDNGDSLADEWWGSAVLKACPFH